MKRNSGTLLKLKKSLPGFAERQDFPKFLLVIDYQQHSQHVLNEFEEHYEYGVIELNSLSINRYVEYAIRDCYELV